MRRRLAVLLPLLAIVPTGAVGEGDSMAQCESRDPDIAIPACTILIDSGRADVAILPTIIVRRADAYASKFQYEQAIKDYNHAIKLRPDHAAAFAGRGLAYANRSNFELAIEDYDRAIRIKPDYARAFYDRGLAKFGLCDLDGADADIAKAKELDPNVGS
jgi:tetratricopeptide (TPR) repeat protein